MSSNPWQQIDALFHAAAERAPHERAAFLDEACAGNDSLRREVESLLSADAAAEEMATAKLPARVAAELLDQQSSRLTAGQLLNQYRILSPLGAGGMGEVFLAEDTRLKRKIALKLLPAQFTSDSDRVRRFEQEALAVSALNHPNILTIYEIGESERHHFLVTEFIEGQTLRQQMNDGRLPVRAVLNVVTQIVSALAAAHAAGIIHRDIKPENIMLRPDGVVKVLDFGLAKLNEPRVSTADPAEKKASTESGVVMGTIGYMSPEQVRGQKVDHRSDIFAVGVILYEMLSGQRAFTGDSAVEVMNAILKEEPPELTETNAKISPALDRIVRRCLEKKPEHRFQSASDLGFALSTLTTPSGVRLETSDAVPPVTGNLRAIGNARFFGDIRLAWLAAALLLIATVGLAWAYFTRQSENAPVQRFSILPPEKVAFALGQPPVISPDGRKLAFIGEDEAGKRLLWVRSLDSLEAQALPNTQGAALPFWSPDSRQLGFFTHEKLKTVEATGGPVQTLCNAEESSGGSWSQAGVIIFSHGPLHRLFQVSVSGGSVTLLMPYDQTRKENSQRWPHFLSDGRHFLFQSLSDIPGKSGIYVGALGEQTARQLLRDVPGPAYTTNDKLIFARDGVLMAQTFDPLRLQLAGEPQTIARQISSTRNNSYFSVSPKGIVTYATGDLTPNSQLVWVDRRGKELGVIGTPADFSFGAKLSPDGKHAAVSLRTTASGALDVWVFDVLRGTPLRMTVAPANNVFPRWSPDGNHIAFGSFRKLPASLYVCNANGIAQDELLLSTNETTTPVDWSPDGRFLLYFSLTSREDKDLWILPVSGEKKAAPWKFKGSEYDEFLGAFSPDGKWIAYTSTESGSTEVYVEPFSPEGWQTEGKWRISSAGGSVPLWRRDGRELFYLTPDLKMMAVSVQTAPVFTASIPQPLFTLPNVGAWPIAYNNDVTADGQKFLIRRPVQTAAQPYTVLLNWNGQSSR